MNRMDDGFYEEDEPVKDVIAAFENGEKGTTARPSRGQTDYYMMSDNRAVAAPRVESASRRQGQTVDAEVRFG